MEKAESLRSAARRFYLKKRFSQTLRTFIFCPVILQRYFVYLVRKNVILVSVAYRI
ncbi:hypothetical protein HMPREF7215_1130 [Pyramidobacter piscolens W5455]|uniref:Uncharacterized protein n=1 Tax=Pyramidobacter piscolens W5455 TaxID=352165 RepID=A0ABP2HQ81_9BACT|nr:hypothetical protein HMPREF7215_1130 [Pyramidobacter piscolens W5455]